MSLNWDLTKCTSWKLTGRKVSSCTDDSHDGDCKKCGERDERAAHTADGQPVPWAVTNGLIWASMAVQLGDLTTDKDVREFAFRMAFYQEMFGAWLNEVPKPLAAMHGVTPKNARPLPRPITTAEVLAHQGMHTNVTNRTRGEFLKSMAEQKAREIAERVSSEIEEAKPAPLPRTGRETCEHGPVLGDCPAAKCSSKKLP